METLRDVVVLIHLIGFAVLFGAWVVELFGKRGINKVMNWGLLVAALAGLALAAPWGTDGDLNHMKIGVKLVVLLIIGALLGIGSARQRKSETKTVPAAIFWLIGLLTLANAAIAVIW